MTTQRDKMRQLFVRHRGNETRIIEEYARAEMRGEVSRARNAYNLSPEQYARALMSDGLRKGWFRSRLSG
jgi:hypothetical protein